MSVRTVMARVMVGVAGAGLALVGGCAEGLEPPAPTPMVPIQTSGAFPFGMEEPCFDDNENADVCGVGSPETLQDWFPKVLVTVPDFWIDAHEVTNEQYAYCVAAGGCTAPRFVNALSASQEEYYDVERWHDHPVVNVTWRQAQEYCEFLGRRLPSEVEWERVAKGPDLANPRPFPAQDITTRAQCREAELRTKFCSDLQDLERAPIVGEDGQLTSTSKDFVVEPGGRVYNLFGNAAEWVAEPFERRVTCADPTPPCTPCWECSTSDQACLTACRDCDACDTLPEGQACFYACPQDAFNTSVGCVQYAASAQPLTIAQLTADVLGTERVIRGASVRDDAKAVCRFPSGARDKADPTQSFSHVGFRCASDTAPAPAE